MFTTQLLASLAAAFYLTASTTSASGIPVVVSPNLNISTNPNVTAYIPPCTNLTATSAPNPYCYTKLQETAYLTNFNLTLPELCAPQELWSTCFLRSVYQKPGPNCTTLTNNNATCAQYNCTSLSLSTAYCPQPTMANDSSSIISNTSSTSSTSSSSGISAQNTSLATAQLAEQFYGAWTVYALQHHIATWSAALSARSSAAAILDALDPRHPNTASSVLTVLIPTYGLNTSVNADAALVRLLRVPTGRPEPAYGNARGRGESSSLTADRWQEVLRERLRLALDLAMGRFDVFLGAVEGGAYSARGLAGVRNLTASLATGA